MIACPALTSTGAKRANSALMLDGGSCWNVAQHAHHPLGVLTAVEFGDLVTGGLVPGEQPVQQMAVHPRDGDRRPGGAGVLARFELRQRVARLVAAGLYVQRQIGAGGG